MTAAHCIYCLLSPLPACMLLACFLTIHVSFSPPLSHLLVSILLSSYPVSLASPSAISHLWRYRRAPAIIIAGVTAPLHHLLRRAAASSLICAHLLAHDSRRIIIIYRQTFAACAGRNIFRTVPVGGRAALNVLAHGVVTALRHCRHLARRRTASILYDTRTHAL